MNEMITRNNDLIKFKEKKIINNSMMKNEDEYIFVIKQYWWNI